MPTDIAIASSGDLFICDGYGQNRIHRFSPEGDRIASWGEGGNGPGQFNIPHNLRIDSKDRIWVCDRENSRIQIFNLDGAFLAEWTGLLRPNTVFFDPHEDVVYIAELTHRFSIYSFDRDRLTGELITQWENALPSDDPSLFQGGPHGLWMDSHGDLYVGEVLLGDTGRLRKYDRQ